MPAKILLADDSLTIQKVIKITLANEPYDILECRNEKDLYKIIKRTPVDLVLLDFNLSEESSGYDLAKKLKEIRPESKVLMMFGTFDTIDENALKHCGIADKIVKPFDSTRFVNLCHELLEGAGPGENALSPLEEGPDEEGPTVDLSGTEESGKSDLLIKFDSTENWVVNSSAEKSGPTEDSESMRANQDQGMSMDEAADTAAASPDHTQRPQSNALLDELRSWDIQVPPVLNCQTGVDMENYERPPVLNRGGKERPVVKVDAHQKSLSQSSSIPLTSANNPETTLINSNGLEDSTSGVIYPNDEDLEYPTIEFSNKGNASGEPSAQDAIKSTTFDNSLGLSEIKLNSGGQSGPPSSGGQTRPTEQSAKRENIFSKFISLNDLKTDDEESHDLSLDETDPGFGLPLTEEEVSSSKKIEMQINDEISVENFWAVDSKEPAKGKTANLEDEIKLERESVGKTLQFDIELRAREQSQEKATASSQLQDKTNELIEQFGKQLSEKLRPLIEDCIRQYCKESIERVAWEILPDLAENLVKKELNHLAEAVKKEMN